MIALLLPAVQAARESARRMTCTNKLKQLGVAIHNFHDTSDGLPPLTVSRSRAFWVVQLLPFMEMNSVYQTMVARNNRFGNDLIGNGVNGWWREPTFVADKQQMASAFSGFHCPSRRSGGAQLYTSSDEGPVTDYVAPLLQDTDISQYDIDTGVGSVVASGSFSAWYHHWSSRASQFVSPLRPGIVPSDDELAMASVDNTNSWKPRDSFAYWADGTSNQLVIGEKHVPAQYLGICDTGNNAAAQPLTADCSLLRPVDGQREFGAARSVRHHLITDPSYEANFSNTGNRNGYGFGSYHPGAVNFLIGDGAIRSFMPITNPDRILVPLTRVNDGRMVDL